MAGRALEGENTRKRLLDEGLSLFSARGHAGVSVRDLTGAAGANVAAIAYHFGNKDGLYKAIVDGVYAELAEALIVAPSASAEMMRAAWAFAVGHRTGVRLLLRHFLDNGRHDDEVFDKWSELLLNAAEARVSVLRPEWAPVRRRVFLVAAMHLVVRLACEDRAQLGRMIGRSDDTDDVVEQWLVGWVQRELGA